MCGIFGVIVGQNSDIIQSSVKNIVDKLFLLSESRGKEASGFAIRLPGGIDVHKSAQPASDLVKSVIYKNTVRDLSIKQNGSFAVVGHSRLVTNGNQLKNTNNQPVVKDNIVGVHNGIVCNVDNLWEKHHDLSRNFEVDTEVILSIFRKYLNVDGQYISAIKTVFDNIEGATSFAILPAFSNVLFLATNTGSIYYSQTKKKDFILFASERNIVEKVLSSQKIQNRFTDVYQLRPEQGAFVNIFDCHFEEFSFNKEMSAPKYIETGNLVPVNILEPEAKQVNFDLLLCNTKISGNNRRYMTAVWDFLYNNSSVKRCTKCALPETMTFINFDEEGVCNYCRSNKKFEVLGSEKFIEAARPLRGNYYGRDCIVGVSGGRDSCYGLHFIKEELGLNPIAFTFDWAVVTDLARRNISRMCGKLGVEHVVFSADINKKRDNIRKNLTAWLKKPLLGTIPILMAGDKEMLLFGRKMIKQTGINLLVWCNGHCYEHTPFKSGFAGMSPEQNTYMNWVSWNNKIRYFSFFLKEVMLNTAYINISLIDTIMAAMWQFVIPIPKNNFFLYDYVPWDEGEINNTLINQYDWELSPDTTTTWRIGDGTAAFYNYVYMVVAGISEHDCFRSSQIREGALERSRALELIKQDNKPRFDTIEWYANIVGVDVNKALDVIHTMPKLYKTVTFG